MAEPTSGRGRDNNFDLLRMGFAYCVVFTHIRELYGADTGFFLFHSSLLGVDGFFMLSGFLIFRSWQNQPSVPGYALKRFFRVFPAYFVVVLLQCVVMMALQWGDTGFGDAAGYLAANAVFLNFLKPAIGSLFADLRVDAVNGALWTLKIETAFYTLMPVAIVLSRSRLPVVLFAAVILSFVYYAVMFDMDQFRLAQQLPGKLRLFAAGMLLAIYGHRISGWTYAAAFAAAATVLCTPLAAWVPVSLAARDILLVSGIMLVAFFLPHIRVRQDISYTVYLTHFPLIQFALLAGWGTTMSFGWFLAVLVVAATLAGLALSRAVERPLLAWGARQARRFPVGGDIRLSRRYDGSRDLA
jgi:peptidoglycan/LPS O-acetylase OafA/YrhL